jgi:hypothetical protein
MSYVSQGIDPTENNETEFNSSDLYDCFEYYQQTDNSEHLELAIQLNVKRNAEVRKGLIELIEYAKASENDYLKNKLTTLKNKLK